MSRVATAAPPPDDADLSRRLEQLGLRGVLDRIDEFRDQEECLLRLLDVEEEDRSQRGLQRRLRNAKLGRFRPMADFDWNWPDALDADHLKDILRLDFIEEAANVVLIGSNGIGKTMIAKNLAYQAILKGYTACFITASELLNDLASQETGSALTRRLKKYARWKLLVIDEIGYLAGSNRHGDLLFQLINLRYGEKPIIVTANKKFEEWGSIFPSSTCVSTMVDRIIHKCEIVNIDGDSYRKKEAEEREQKRQAKRRTTKKPPRRKKGE